jgi:DNA (cytosine-5)-methyltransferase 1
MFHQLKPIFGRPLENIVPKPYPKGGIVNELALFAGAGGGILGGHLLGWRTVCAVEWEPYPASVLLARQNDKILPPFPIWDDVQTFDGNPWRGIVDVISGGFPCQDISAAGKGAGITGSRSSMWKHMARIIGEVRPQYVYVENSPMLVTRGLNVVLADLASLGFDAKWGVVSAADVGANHKRERIWILANSKHFGRISAQEVGSDYGIQQQISTRSQLCVNEFTGTGCVRQDTDMADTSSTGSQGEQRQEQQGTGVGFANESQVVAYTDSKRGCLWETNRQDAEDVGQSSRGATRPEWWHFEPNVGRVGHGVAARVDRLKAIGNGQVPEVARTAWGLLK